MKLIIVESPAKCKTLQKYVDDLGDYVVLASAGHIREIAKNGIDEKNNFKTKYTKIRGKAKYINQLKASASNADEVIIATDADREGHAIGWHIAKVLDLDIKTTKRIIFHEITKKAIQDALENPTTIDMKQVNSQKGRSVLDRLIGFKFSPLLWKHVQNKLSAGRVQSVATRLIVDKENEITEYTSTTNYKITGEFFPPSTSTTSSTSSLITAKLSKVIKNKPAVIKFLNKCKKEDTTYNVADIVKRKSTKNPPPPFITSTLQQSAGKSCGMSPKMVMSVAQKLYEKGKITYHRTDSMVLSQYIMGSIKTYVVEKYGDRYHKQHYYGASSNSKNKNKNKKGGGAKAQEAHEAIRPTNIKIDNLSQEKGNFTPFEIKLYNLIWKRTVASQMSAQELEITELLIDISCYKHTKYHFKAKHEHTTFKGYTILYDTSTSNSIHQSAKNPFDDMKKSEPIKYKSIEAKQNISTPPPRYSEHSLVSEMKKRGIGRPSTYAYITSVIQDRNYVEKKSTNGEKKTIEVLRIDSLSTSSSKINESKTEIIYNKETKKLFPTSVGIQVTNFLLEHFPNQMNFEYTNNVENQLDDIATGKVKWTEVITNEYNNFMPTVTKLNGIKKDITKNMFYIGKHPKTDEDINAYIGKYGPVLRIGNQPQQPLDSLQSDSQTKFKYVSLDKKTNLKKLTLNNILPLIRYPLIVGHHNDKEIVIKNGQYGKYIVYDGNNYSLSKYKLTEEDETKDKCLKIINKTNTNAKKNILKTFDDCKYITIRNGKYGPYICQTGKSRTAKPINAKIPKHLVDKIEEITLDECKKLIENRLINPPSFKSFGFGYKKK